MLGADVHRKGTLVIVAVHSYRVNYLTYLNKFSSKVGVRYPVQFQKTSPQNSVSYPPNIVKYHKSYPRIFCTAGGTQYISYVVLPEQVDTCATRAQYLLESKIASHFESICWAHGGGGRGGLQIFRICYKSLFKIFVEFENLVPFKVQPLWLNVAIPAMLSLLETLSKIFNRNAVKGLQRVSLNLCNVSKTPPFQNLLHLR